MIEIISDLFVPEFAGDGFDVVTFAPEKVYVSCQSHGAEHLEGVESANPVTPLQVVQNLFFRAYLFVRRFYAGCRHVRALPENPF